jgi:hypothetical protein
MIKTKQEITKEFKTKLQALLQEYNAELSCEDHWMGYAECGEDVRMTVDIPGVYNEFEEISEWTTIDLGKFFDSTSKF